MVQSRRSARLVVLVVFVAFVAFVVAWASQVHRLFGPDGAEAARVRDAMTARQTSASDPSELRAVNPEWDFMRRTYVVLALANQAMALAAPSSNARELRAKLSAMDALIDGTLRDEASRGQGHFLLGYAHAKPFVDPEATSVFVDGELLAMIAAREMVAPHPDARRRREARRRAARIEAAMRRSPTLSAESYPDECWTFCNTFALAALAMLDHVDGSDHRELSRAWIAAAREHLVDPQTGLLVSSFTRDGRTLDGPEGSSLWMTAHNLSFVDAAFARDQYERARHELRGSFAGFGWAREWPRGTPVRPDIDSGPIVPFLDASPGSSGLAILGATVFDDRVWRTELLASLDLAALRAREDDRYLLSNDVGDAVILYALSFGPLSAKMAGTTR